MLITVEPGYFKLSGEMKVSLKLQELEIPDCKWLKGKSKGEGFERKIMGDSK